MRGEIAIDKNVGYRTTGSVPKIDKNFEFNDNLQTFIYRIAS
jgi:hypothetical protein